MKDSKPDANEDKRTTSHERDLRVFRYRSYRRRQGFERFLKTYLLDVWWGFARKLNQVEFLVEVIGVTVLAVYTAYTIKMYYANKEAADAARSAADTAANTLTQSMEQFRLEERPWIEVELGEPTLQSPANDKFAALYKYPFGLKNTGKTTAFDIACRVPRQAFLAGEGFGDHQDWIANGQVMLLNELPFAGASEDDKIRLLSKRMPQAIGPGMPSATKLDLFGQEPKNRGFNYLVGRIDYTDAFMVKHWTTFCFFVDIGGPLRYCRAGNEQDRNYNPPPTPRR